MSEEQGIYKVTHVVEITAYVRARNPRVALAINYQESYYQHSYHHIWDGQMRTTSETVEKIEQVPEEAWGPIIPPKIPCPYIMAAIVAGPYDDRTDVIWIPVKLVEEDGLDEAANIIYERKCTVIACNQKKYYLDGTDELWQPISEGGKR